MTKRLVKIAKELNVGTSTIVDYLNENGFDIDNKPTAKVTEPMYNALLKEFQKSIDIKEKAAQINIGVRAKKEEEAAAQEKEKAAPTPKAQEPATPEAPQEEKKEAPAAKEEAPAAKKEEEAKKEEVAAPKADGPKLKVLGKIDLSESSRKRGKKKATPAKKEEPAEAKEEQQEAPKSKPAAEKKEKVSEKKEKQQEAPQSKPAAEKKEEPAAKKEEAPAKEKEAKPSKEETAAPAAKKTEEKTEESATTKKEGVIKANAPELRGLKVLGKIDTDKFKKPKKKKKEPAKDGNKKSDSKKDDNTRRRRRRRRVTVEGNTGGGRNRGRGRGGNRKDRKKQDEIKEVSQKEIDEKIKATMARLSGGGKKKRQRLQRDKRARIREKEEQKEIEQETGPLELTEFVSVQELANLMDVPVTDVITTCMNLGIMVSINQRLDAEIIELVAEEFGHEVEFISAEEQIIGDEVEEEEDDPADLEPRAPIVTVMGHVDHGKTSLLDHIRKENVASGEAGGITQHVGAYEVVREGGQKITFLDTPGHEAFTAMRARGAKVTDIAIIIIAADDNIMPQTKEAISHAQAAGVPMVFAINKIDKPGAQPERIKQELAEMNLLVEEWGGKYQSQDISAKTGDGIDELLEKVILEAEILELQANPDRLAQGAIVEASIEKGRGYVAKILVQNGTLRIGDPLVAGEFSGKVKALINDQGKRLEEAGPAQPVLVLGLDGAPQAGELVKVAESEQEARQIASKRAQIMREQSNRATKRISLDEIGRRLALGTFKELNLIVKGDVDGSVEALSDALIKLSIETVQVNVIHKAVGAIAESDVLLASASDAIIIGFQVRPSLGARKLAEREGVEIKMYSIIYEAIEEIKMAIEGMLEPTKEEKIRAEVEVREIFKISKVGTIAGCFVRDGKINRNHHIRLIRDGIVVYPNKEGKHGEIDSLKRFKDDVKEVRNGMECGLSIKNFNDIKVGDVVEAYEIIEVKQTLD